MMKRTLTIPAMIQHRSSSMTSMMTLAAAVALALNTLSFGCSQIFHTMSMTKESKATNLKKAKASYLAESLDS
jgi:hypothetical protein